MSNTFFQGERKKFRGCSLLVTGLGLQTTARVPNPARLASPYPLEAISS